MNKTQSLFISHGSPMLALTQEPTTKFLRSIALELPKPKAIIVVSAHWETKIPTITGANKLETIHDFYGFPQELYELRYPASGNPELAENIKEMLEISGVNSAIDKERGLDHGAWNPLLLMYPEADIPVLQISVQPKKDAMWHYKIGQILAPMRAQNILIIGSGNLTHNLREAFRGNHAATPSWVTDFAEWVEQCMTKNDIDSLLDWQNIAPYAIKNHPTPEHLLPLFVAMGASCGASEGALTNSLQAKRLHKDTALGVLAMDAYSFS